MGITPVELAAFLPKSQEVSIQRHSEVQKPVNEQVVLNHSMHEQTMRDSTKTVMPEKSDQPEYRYDGSSGNGKGMLYERKNRKNKKSKDQPEGNQSMNGFDIRI